MKLYSVPQDHSQENSVNWENTLKCKEGKAVSNHVFPMSRVGIFYLGLELTLFTLPIAKRYGDVATLT
jgi:hypothetical protein